MVKHIIAILLLISAGMVSQPAHAQSAPGKLRLLSGWCLDVDLATMNSNFARVQIWGCWASPNQNWRFDALGRIVGDGGKCLDVVSPRINVGVLNLANGTAVQVYDCHDGRNQRWDMLGTVLKLHGTNKCLDVVSPNIASGVTNFRKIGRAHV